jgi:transposase
MADWVISHLKFIDETGIDLGMTRLYGRASPGERVVEGVPSHYGTKLTLLAALGIGGVIAPMVIEGAVDGEVFQAYVRQALGPTLRPGDIVILDNLSVHKVAGVAEAIHARGAKLEYLPPYCSDYNPIEKLWSKIKLGLRSAKARIVDQIIQAVKDALLTISHADARAWFVHSGYPIY